MLSRPRRSWRVPIFLLLFTIVFYWKILFTNRVMIPWDAADFFYPYLSFVHEELRHLRLPLWDPYVMSGYPIIGDLEAQIFYPVNWLLVLLHPFSPLPYKWVEAQLILHFFLAGLFMYYLARDFTSDARASLLSAVLFMSGGTMVAHTQHLASINAMAWYPAIFLLARRGLLEGKLFYAVCSGMLLGVQALAGHWQHTVYLGFFLFLFFLYEACLGQHRAELWPRWVWMLVLIAGIAAALAMVQVIPTQELGGLSVRTYLRRADVTQGSEPRFLWTLFLPNFFGGLRDVPKWYDYDLSFNYVFLTVPGCLLALAGLVERARRRDFFWLGIILLSVELSIGEFGHLASVLWGTPLLNLFRNPATFFDLANFSLCLMAGVGAKALLSKDVSRWLKRQLPIWLGLLVLCATSLGLLLGWWRIAGWFHMLAALAVTTVVVAARLRNRISPSVSQVTTLGIIIFQVCFYNMNDRFNTTGSDPRTYASRDYASHGKDVLAFLRSDRSNDFRMAAIAESIWAGNGANVWRIPSIYGWNPITLRRYEEYIRRFTHTGDYTLPYGGPDHDYNSPLFELLGAKYLLLADPVLEAELGLRRSERFDLVLELEYSSLYRSKSYISRGWFYPRGYVIPDHELALALINSRWFQARRTLLFEKQDLGSWNEQVEELPATHLSLKDIEKSTGSLREDPECGEQRLVLADWGAKGAWIRYTLSAEMVPGRYLLLAQYTAGYRPTPSLRVELTDGEQVRSHDAVHLLGTSEWGCRKTRTAQLAEMDLPSRPVGITIHSEVDSLLQLYDLWLVRLPSSPPPDPGVFAIEDYSASADWLSFAARVERSGFLLLNEIYYPGWEATVDGRPAKILRADTIFRALYLPAGEHRIEFRFRPRHFAWGAAISGLTVACFVGYLLALRYRKRTGKTEPRP